MELYMQMGHGMKNIAKDYLNENHGGTVIISPMNIAPSSVIKYAGEVHRLEGNILFDPQIYFPRKFHKNLVKYEYYPKENITDLESGNIKQIMSNLADLNKRLETESLIIPNFSTKKIDHLWEQIQNIIIDTSNKVAPDIKKFHTVALNADIVKDIDSIEAIISFAEEWEVEGIYIVCEHPKNSYFVEEPLWLSNIMHLVAGIKRQGKKVIVGYCNQQMLSLALAKCDAIASGNFLNLRWFQPSHFESEKENTPSRRTTWYYCPQTLSEYKIPFLDIASRMGVLDRMRPSAELENLHAASLFSANRPTNAEFKEGHAFRHYLYCLGKQCIQYSRNSYQETLDAQLLMLETAQQLSEGLREVGVRGQNRDFTDFIDVNRAAISVFDSDYGFQLSNEWNVL